MTDPRFAGVERLYGAGSVAKLARARVAVIGLGGVGSWSAEALARSGVGSLALIDADEVCVSNTNRQLHTLESTLGRSKVLVMAERLRAINPALVVQPVQRFVTPDSITELLDAGFDLVLDACDAFRVKVEMTAWCRRRKLPLLVCGSAGGRSDATLIRVRDLSRTEHDALLGLMRRKLRQEFNFPKNPARYFGVPAVYSLENVRYPQPDGSVCGLRPGATANGGARLGCEGGLGAATHVTATFGMVAAGRVLQMLLARPTGSESPSRETAE
ncbi:MAG TPA: tRNA threonylcarbamoyladenosine dehydratase [Rhodanobacteraceae bacterium]